VIKYLNKGIDEVRKKEVKETPILKNSKYLMLKNSERLSDKERARYMEIETKNLRISKAWKMREFYGDI
jgi:hypothetical protein